MPELSIAILVDTSPTNRSPMVATTTGVTGWALSGTTTTARGGVATGMISGRLH